MTCLSIIYEMIVLSFFINFEHSPEKVSTLAVKLSAALGRNTTCSEAHTQAVLRCLNPELIVTGFFFLFLYAIAIFY